MWTDPDGNVTEAPPFETREEALEAVYRREPVHDVACSDVLVAALAKIGASG